MSTKTERISFFSAMPFPTQRHVPPDHLEPIDGVVHDELSRPDPSPAHFQETNYRTTGPCYREMTQVFRPPFHVFAFCQNVVPFSFQSITESSWVINPPAAQERREGTNGRESNEVKQTT